MDKAKLTFVLPESMQHDLRQQIIRDGYGMRGKSKWVSEAVERLLAVSNFHELVNYSDEMKGFGTVETVVIPFSLKQRLEAAILQTRQSFPMLEGVQSRILRTSILQRLILSS